MAVFFFIAHEKGFNFMHNPVNPDWRILLLNRRFELTFNTDFIFSDYLEFSIILPLIRITTNALLGSRASSVNLFVEHLP